MTCAHDLCTCIVSESNGYCSEHCQMSADAGEIGTPGVTEEGGVAAECGCGHPACDSRAKELF